MSHSAAFLSLVLAASITADGLGQDAKPAAAPAAKAAGKTERQRRRPEAFEPIQDVAGLPRVLLIGDSISIGYTLPVRQLLAGKANVHRPPTNCGRTSIGVEQLDRWLGDGRWDVIHFNFGLHDVRLENNKPWIAPADYEKNLRQIVARLKKTGAKLIWATTTPVPEGSLNRKSGDELIYNSIAAKVMAENQVAVNDLYAFCLPRLTKIQLPANVHFSPDGSKVLAGQVAEAILAALKK